MNINNISARRMIMVIIAVLFLVSGFGIQRAFSLPSEVEEETVVLNYKHVGEFDYVTHLKGSYLYGDIPLEASPYSTQIPDFPEAPQSNPKYPLDHVEAIDMNFTYSFIPDQIVEAQTSTEIEIRASVNRGAAGREELLLLPATALTGDPTVRFTIVGEQLASATSTTITVDAYTTVKSMLSEPMFESFTQILTISSVGPLIEVSSPLHSSQRASFGEYSYEQAGVFDYSVQLKPNSPFGAISLTPPSAPSPTPPLPLSSMTLGPGQPLFYSLMESMDFTFSYQFGSDEPLKQVSEDVSISAVLENPGGWRKEFPLVLFTSKTGDFVVSFSLNRDDFNYFNDVYRVIERETGISGAHTLVMKADVFATAQTDHGPISERFNQTLSTTLGGDIIEWKEDLLVQSQTGDIRISQMAPNLERIMGLPVGWVRGLSILLTVIILIALLYSIALNVWLKPEEVSLVEKEIRQAKRRHKDAIVDVKEIPAAVARDRVIRLGSLEEIIKTSDDMLRPVLHMAEVGRHTYCIVDGSMRYEYVSEI